MASNIYIGICQIDRKKKTFQWSETPLMSLELKTGKKPYHLIHVPPVLIQIYHNKVGNEQGGKHPLWQPDDQ